MLIGIVNGELFTKETRPFEEDAFAEINNKMATLNLDKRDKLGNLVFEKFYRVIQAEAFHKYCGEPLPKWFSKEKSKMDKYIQNRSKKDVMNPHYIYEEFIWETDSDAYKYASEIEDNVF